MYMYSSYVLLTNTTVPQTTTQQKQQSSMQQQHDTTIKQPNPAQQQRNEHNNSLSKHFLVHYILEILLPRIPFCLRVFQMRLVCPYKNVAGVSTPRKSNIHLTMGPHILLGAKCHIFEQIVPELC